MNPRIQTELLDSVVQSLIHKKQIRKSASFEVVEYRHAKFTSGNVQQGRESGARGGQGY